MQRRCQFHEKEESRGSRSRRSASLSQQPQTAQIGVSKDGACGGQPPSVIKWIGNSWDVHYSWDHCPNKKPLKALQTLNQKSFLEDFVNFWRYMPTKWLQQRAKGSKNGHEIPQGRAFCGHPSTSTIYFVTYVSVPQTACPP